MTTDVLPPTLNEGTQSKVNGVSISDEHARDKLGRKTNGNLEEQPSDLVKSNTNDDTNGQSEGDQEIGVSQFDSKTQQEILLLHGPGQKYHLETNGQIPELRQDREILIQVSCI